MIGLTPDIVEAAVVRHGVLRLSVADELAGEVEVLDRMRGQSSTGRARRRASQRSASIVRRERSFGLAVRTWLRTPV